MSTLPTLLRPTLELPGLSARLRPWQPTDAEALAWHANDADVARYLRDVFPHPYGIADAQHYLRLVTDPASAELTVAIEVGGEAAGSISLLFQPDISRRSAEIGYWLGRQFWGMGLATAAVRALSAYGLAHFDLVRLYATVYAPNLASARVLEKAGYTLEGRLIQAVTKHQQVLDALLFARVKPLSHPQMASPALVILTATPTRMTYDASPAFAAAQDAADSLAPFRQEFHLPPGPDGQHTAYFCGNSLGLLPKAARAAVEAEFKSWETQAVEGHFHGESPWIYYQDTLADATARVVGAKPIEVVVMNTLTVNLHLLLVSFYQPTATRYKVLMEGGAFPSDQYALESQARLHGLDPADAIVEMVPRPGEHTLRTEDIAAKIAELGDSLATVIFGGINYYTGQVFDMAAITKAGHAVGATVGFDLAHAAGNVVLHLHDWDVDFACWCTYKYLNSGPGGTSGVFINERFAHRPDLLRLAGWWGHDPQERFQMKPGFRPSAGASGWQLSCGQVLPMAVHRANLDIFDRAGGVPALRTKSEKLTGYLEFLIQQLGLPPEKFEIITPADPSQRGCQLSLLVHERGRELFDFLAAHGIIADWREPNVIRLAPVPLYNSFEDVRRAGAALQQFYHA